MELSTSIQNVMVTAGWAAALTTVSVMTLSSLEHRGPFAPVNAISHIAFGQASVGVEAPKPKLLVTGLVLNAGAMIGWAAVAELGYAVFRLPAGVLLAACPIAILTTVLAFIVDFHVVPKRLSPGFEMILSKRSLLIVYVAMGAALVVGGLLRAR